MKGITQASGFSLFELLLVLAISGILANLAYPLYQQVLVKARRTEAKVALLALANQLEFFYIKNNYSYANATLEKLGFAEKTARNAYRLALISEKNSYTLTATALFKDDPACSQLRLDQQLKKSSTGSQKTCW